MPQVGSGNSYSNFPSADLTGSPEPGLLGKKSNVKLTICAKSDIQNAQLFSFPFYCRLSVLCTVHTFWSRTAFNRRIGMKEVKKVPMAMQLFSGIGWSSSIISSDYTHCTKVLNFWSGNAFNIRIGMKEVEKVPMAMQLFSGIGWSSSIISSDYTHCTTTVHNFCRGNAFNRRIGMKAGRKKYRWQCNWQVETTSHQVSCCAASDYMHQHNWVDFMFYFT